MVRKLLNIVWLLRHPAAGTFAILLTLPSATLADPDATGCMGNVPEENILLREIACMSDDELQTFRGGFIHNNQIVIGFGFERIVRIDGEVQEHIIAGLPSLNLTGNIQLVPINRAFDAGTSRYLMDLGASGAASGRLAADGVIFGSAPQLQIVPSSSALQEMMSNVIQNSLDNKVIDQIRVVNIDLMGLGNGARVDPSSDLQSAIFESLGQ